MAPDRPTRERLDEIRAQVEAGVLVGNRATEAVLAEVDYLHSWVGLTSLLDAHWPADVFSPDAATNEGADPGVRILALIRWVDRLKTERDHALAEVDRLTSEREQALATIREQSARAARAEAELRRANELGTAMAKALNRGQAEYEAMRQRVLDECARIEQPGLSSGRSELWQVAIAQQFRAAVDGEPAAEEAEGEEGRHRDLAAEVRRQDTIHPAGYPATRDGLRFGLATIGDECREAYDEWRANRRLDGWGNLRAELLQVAAVAMRTVRRTTVGPARIAAGLANGSAIGRPRSTS